MTTTRSTFARCASRLAWLLPLALAELSAACGTSPSTIGESAGAAGTSPGSAGKSATNGGSPSGSGGSSSGHAGAAGSNTSGGSTEVGGASGSANAGGSGTGGPACTTDADCDAGFICLYKIADTCSAKGNCFKEERGEVTCQAVTQYCGCSGEIVGVPCYEPDGYSPEPVAGRQTTATCPTPDGRCAGKGCGEACGTGEVPSFCDAEGKCQIAGPPNCP